MPQHNTALRGVSPRGYEEARRRAVYFERLDRGRIVLSGPDRASFLQGLLTNDVGGLKAGEGRYSAYLTPQGRMITDLYVYEIGDVMLVALPLATKDAVLARLDQFIFSEDVQLGDVTAAFSTVAIIGPAAATVVAGIVGADAGALASFAEHASVRVQFDGTPAIVTRVVDTGEPGFDVYVEPPHLDALVHALKHAGIEPIDAATADVLRIEAGLPVFGRDMDETTIPLEAGIEQRAISFTKGCYVGQEVIIRVLHRGHGRVAKRLVGLTVDGDAVPSEGASIAGNGNEIGTVTSSAWSPALDKPIALGYVHRDFTAPGTEVEIAGTRAIVTALPFVARPES
jgi:folate-binding protein YgfZ